MILLKIYDFDFIPSFIYQVKLIRQLFKYRQISSGIEAHSKTPLGLCICSFSRFFTCLFSFTFPLSIVLCETRTFLDPQMVILSKSLYFLMLLNSNVSYQFGWDEIILAWLSGCLSNQARDRISIQDILPFNSCL